MKNKTLYNALLSLSALLVVIGLYIFFQVSFNGQGYLFHSDDNMPWTLLIASYVFFVLTSTGATLVAALPTVFGIEAYQPIVKRAIFIALAALVAGFISMGMELGSPLNMYNYVLSPNFSSPIWWMGLFYASLLVVLLLKFYRIHTNKPHSAVDKRLAILAFVLEIAALSTLGSVFGLIEARPTFFGEYIQVYFLFSAILCGLAALLFFQLMYFRFMGQETPEQMRKILYDFGKGAAVMLGLTILFSVWRAAIALYSNQEDFYAIQYILNSWPYRIELFVGLLLPFFILLSKKLRSNNNVLLFVAVLVLLGMGIGRMDLVLTGQLLPVLPMGVKQSGILFYFPTIWEWFAGLCSMGFMLMAILLGERFLGLNGSKSLGKDLV